MNWAYRQNQEDGWNHTAAILAMIHNCSMGCEKAKRVIDFHPLKQGPRMSSVQQLEMFLDEMEADQ